MLAAKFCVFQPWLEVRGESVMFGKGLSIASNNVNKRNIIHRPCDLHIFVSYFLIHNSYRFAQAYPDGSNYFILLIITDGVISDMEMTKDAIIKVR